jgi:hypothetical protein
MQKELGDAQAVGEWLGGRAAELETTLRVRDPAPLNPTPATPSPKVQTVDFQIKDLPCQHPVYGMLQGGNGPKNWSMWSFREGWWLSVC